MVEPLSPRELGLLADLVAERVVVRLRATIDADALLDATQAANLLGISRATLERRIADGTLRPQRVGRLRRFRRSELLTMNESTAADAPSAPSA
ncbi:MAG TPA: hypothetical protein DCQ98_19275 [Planctomycetaceae bacterium]|nr:hypothetical protein [Planctomycetaceae bacterium]HRF02327.1 helix-turn-helix domain-containing protein [Pirellulaceae bacterium]